ncbi:DUF3168 domain-containing protein [Oryzicola mucosus]|uniref:DUF3168 domain-containing protein n=1 Tax=Oryzicola mucosus TaxID=2767425 RepID=A0A8J6PWW4_9HYPH|nr:DUF3168 domain-containing protein [Oryzicola mucosus]MBD0416506.1 DUF3168 domain-containing protein [Oryzicola mucosus]
MSDPLLEFRLQVAFVTLLTGLGTEAGERVYDDIPEAEERAADTGAAFPYISVGPGQLIPIDEECWDRSQFYHQIDVWSREPGFPEAKKIAGEIRSALHENEQALTIAGHVLDRIRVESIDYLIDRDGLTHRARMLVLTETQPAT